MKTKLLAISLLFAFTMVIFHEMFPHHHHEMDDDLLFSHQHHTSRQTNYSASDTDHHFPIPAHHHLSATEDFDLIRTGSGTGNDLQPSVQFVFIYLKYSFSLADSDPPEKTVYPETSVPLNSHPFIISPNAMRGSPAFA